MATQVDIPFQGWSLSGQDQSKEGGTGLVQEMLDHGSISFGRYAMEPLSWEKHSVFSHDTCQEELGKLTHPGLVAQKKAYFEEYYKKIRALKAMEENGQTQSQNTHEISTEHVEINPNVDQMRECEANASISSVPEVVVINELHENEKTGKEHPLQLVLRSTTNRVEHENCKTEVSVEKYVHQNVIMSPLQSIRRKIVDKFEHEKKLKQEFDSLSKDWVKLKKGMTPIGCKEREESEIDNQKDQVASVVTKSIGAFKDITISQGNLPKQKVCKHQINSFKDLKQPTKKANSRETRSTRLSKLNTRGRVACNSRPNSLSSRNSRPLTRAKTSLPSMIEANIIRSKAMEKSVSNPSLTKAKSTRRNSLDSLMKPTASSSARSNKSEVKRNSGVLKKPPPSCVPKVHKRDASVTVLPKRRSFNVLAQDKSRPRTRSDMAFKTPPPVKKPKEPKVALMSKKRVEPKKALDSNTRPKKLLAQRKEALPNYKRTKPGLLKKKQRHEKPPWR